MQGFVLNLRKYRDEDLLVFVLTPKKLKTLYRFYGARHSAINLGYMIDFAAEPILNRNLHRLRDVTHLGFDWIGNFSKMRTWQGFCALLYEHLKETNEIDSFYFELLEEACAKLSKTAAKRVLAESYLKILEAEGRLHSATHCFFCAKKFKDGERIALTRGMLPSHESCIYEEGFKKEKIELFFENKSLFCFDDGEVDALYGVIERGF